MTQQQFYDENRLTTDINRVFIPCRPILEMEILTSITLIEKNYNDIKFLAMKNASPNEIAKTFNASDGVLTDICERFDVLLQKMRPVSMLARAGSETSRYQRIGNVDAYTPSRIPIFFALDRLKVKFLLIHNFFTKLRSEVFNLQDYELPAEDAPNKVEGVLYSEYISRLNQYFDLITPQKHVAAHTKNLRIERTSTNLLLAMNTIGSQDKFQNQANYMMRGITASLFVSKLLFKRIDVPEPFTFFGDYMINAEEIMLSNEFLPELIKDISRAYTAQEWNLLPDLFKAFDFMMRRVLEGINNAIKIASNHRIQLRLDEIQYFIGDLCQF